LSEYVGFFKHITAVVALQNQWLHGFNGEFGSYWFFGAVGYADGVYAFHYASDYFGQFDFEFFDDVVVFYYVN
jgi:hypothetical protein